jgi:hypothetical protein
MASEARRTRAEKEATTSQPAPEPSGEPPATSGESGTAGA